MSTGDVDSAIGSVGFSDTSVEFSRGLSEWAKRQEQLTEALGQQRRAKDLARQAEQAHELRDLAIGRENIGVRATLRQARDILLAVHSGNPRKLGDFGFEVSGTASSTDDKDEDAPAPSPAGA